MSTDDSKEDEKGGLLSKNISALAAFVAILATLASGIYFLLDTYVAKTDLPTLGSKHFIQKDEMSSLVCLQDRRFRWLAAEQYWKIKYDELKDLDVQRRHLLSPHRVINGPISDYEIDGEAALQQREDELRREVDELSRSKTDSLNRLINNDCAK